MTSLSTPYDSVGFHNVAELDPQAMGLGGTVLRRFPPSVRHCAELSEIGREFTAHTSNGCEIRFFSEHPSIRVYLSTLIERTHVSIFRGEYECSVSPITIEGGRVNRLVLKQERLTQDRKAFQEDRFPPELWRIVCHDAPIIFCGTDRADGVTRPPGPSDVPARRWLAYGSSITQCGNNAMGYVNMTARELGVDVLNLGMGGSCFMEPCLAEHICDRDDWNFATFELGINVLSTWTEEEFASAAYAFVKKVKERHPANPVVVISNFRNGHDYASDPDALLVKRNQAYREIIRQMVSDLAHPNLHHLNGLDVFSDLRGFQSDLLHPLAYANVRAGLRLASALRELLPGALN